MDVPFFLESSSESQEKIRSRRLIRPPSITLPSLQLPGLLCFGAGFLSFIVWPLDLSFASFLEGATLMVDSSSLRREAEKYQPTQLL